MSQGAYLILGLQTPSLLQDGSLPTGQGGVSCPGVEKSFSCILNFHVPYEHQPNQGSLLQPVLRF